MLGAEVAMYIAVIMCFGEGSIEVCMCKVCFLSSCQYTNGVAHLLPWLLAVCLDQWLVCTPMVYA